MTIVCYQVFSFVFSVNSLISSGFPLASFHLVEPSLSAFSWLYTLVCEFVQKYHEMSFLFIITHNLSTHFAVNLFFLPQLENVNKLKRKNRTMHVNKEIKTKTKPSHVIYKLTMPSIVRFSPKQCNGIIKGWLHINVQFSMMFGHGTNSIFLGRKNKLDVQNTRLPPPPYPTLSPPPKSKLWKGCFFAFFLSSCPHVFEEIILRLFQVFFSVNKIMIENIAIDLKKIKTCNSSLFFILTPNFYQ